MATTKKPAKTAKSGEDSGAFSAQEKAAMKERAAEVRAAKRAGTGSKKAEADAKALADKLAEMPKNERTIGQGIHDIVAEVAPDLAPKTWYGMPAWARDGKVLCFFQHGSKFETRYSTLGFNDLAALDDGPMWPASFAILTWNDDVAARVRELITRATA